MVKKCLCLTTAELCWEWSVSAKHGDQFASKLLREAAMCLRCAGGRLPLDHLAPGCRYEVQPDMEKGPDGPTFVEPFRDVKCAPPTDSPSVTVNLKREPKRSLWHVRFRSGRTRHYATNGSSLGELTVMVNRNSEPGMSGSDIINADLVDEVVL